MHVEDAALTFQKKPAGSRNVARTGREERERDTVNLAEKTFRGLKDDVTAKSG